MGHGSVAPGGGRLLVFAPVLFSLKTSWHGGGRGGLAVALGPGTSTRPMGGRVASRARTDEVLGRTCTPTSTRLPIAIACGGRGSRALLERSGEGGGSRGGREGVQGRGGRGVQGRGGGGPRGGGGGGPGEGGRGCRGGREGVQGREGGGPGEGGRGSRGGREGVQGREGGGPGEGGEGVQGREGGGAGEGGEGVQGGEPPPPPPRRNEPYMYHIDHSAYTFAIMSEHRQSNHLFGSIHCALI